MSNSSIRDTFFEECEELLEALVEGLAAMEENASDMEVVNAVFRAVHSIKGGAGAFALDRLVNFAHTFETVMDKVRSKQLDVDEQLMMLFHRSGDQLADLVEAARDGREPNAESEAAILKELGAYLDDAENEEELAFDAAPLAFDAAPMAIDLPEAEAEPPGEPEQRRFDIRFRPSPALYANGHEPLLLFDALAELGTLSVIADLSRLPEFDSFDPEDAVIDWRLTLQTSEDETVLHEVFEFVDALCELEIEVSEEPAESLPADLPEPADPIAAAPPPPDPAVPAALTTEPQGPAQKPAKQSPPRDEPRGPRPTLRVDLDRVDRLINTVGELIINQAMISQRIEELELPAVAHLTNELEAYKLLARDIQEGVMAIRAQPVKPLFQRMSRIVREAAEATGKKVKLVTVGDSTEVDKTVIERLADPLTHMVRNAVDHGLERPDKRSELGKDPAGSIRLSASHRSGSVFIEIADDGAGLNRTRILEKAIEKGLVSPEAELSEQEIDNLLFLPGFSTASEVSNLSGRGVGMDVVKNAVAALGGRVSIASTPGMGTTFTIVLPLTLAVMDGFVISIADQTMVIPIASIIETIRPNPRDLHCIGTDGEVISVRGAYVPIVDVARNLGLSGEGADSSGVLLLVSTEGQGLTALRVGAIHDQRQVVIKSLESNYGAIAGVSAATILGDGKIALILDPDELVKLTPAALFLPPAPPPKPELRHA
ncbi:chemotaxis protein CheA [Salipiger bermudensis]|uniref:chemotaxis protein CheA n=1 Tax=Salipiger bermudensis TaxID=344736 RepID=UPI001C99D03B|nr:chemotaxis protein CheA [Salipiger bermudensis]MBY6002451.1 chemotaxis protein CheA [Salipiger bermudensis]